ncbi:MAG: NADH-quinone oxidoreductase subunit J [Candidatus Omnitrophica bacterium]|nr:NADH-quinone oxidoreductase subunit J [Candidatus Omnitrophota bacterium]
MNHLFFFYTLAVLLIGSALGIILARNPVYAVLSLVSTLFALSGLFVLLGAYFVAAIQVILYAGAILVLFLFVVMLLDLTPETLFKMKGGTLKLAGTLFGLFFLWQFAQAVRTFTPFPTSTTSSVAGTTAAVGKLLFTTYALPFEVASGLVVVGIIGAIVLAKKKVP